MGHTSFVFSCFCPLEASFWTKIQIFINQMSDKISLSDIQHKESIRIVRYLGFAGQIFMKSSALCPINQTNGHRHP